MYSLGADNKWYKTEHSPQCEERVFFIGKCQGIKGHKGRHWCYSERGDYQYADNKDEQPAHRCTSGDIPPDHENYISPVDLIEESYTSTNVTTEVTDPKLIARLNNDELEDGESSNQAIAVDDVLDILYDDLEESIAAGEDTRPNAHVIASLINKLPPDEYDIEIQWLQATFPTVYEQVVQEIAYWENEKSNKADPLEDVKPLD